MAYNLVEKKLLELDWDLYLPLLEDTKIDCIIVKGCNLWKLQIKTIQSDRGHKFFPVRKITHNQGEYKIKLYSQDEIDFFIGADLETEELYIVPSSFSSQYKSTISTNTLKPFLNNFNLLEPCRGNSISEEDDIGEGLTANTEGTANSRPVETR